MNKKGFIITGGFLILVSILVVLGILLSGGGLLAFNLGGIPPFVWIGVGFLLLYLITGKKK